MSTNRLFYARALLVAGEMHRGPQQEQVLVAIMTGEDTAAAWNPLDTTLEYGNHTPYNSFGPDGSYHVWNYATAAEGVAATLATLKQPNMARFYDAMKQPDQHAAELARAFSFTPWGGIGDLLPFEIVTEYIKEERSYVADRRNIVHGCGDWPYRADGERAG